MLTHCQPDLENNREMSSRIIWKNISKRNRYGEYHFYNRYTCVFLKIDNAAAIQIYHLYLSWYRIANSGYFPQHNVLKSIDIYIYIYIHDRQATTFTFRWVSGKGFNVCAFLLFYSKGEANNIITQFWPRKCVTMVTCLLISLFDIFTIFFTKYLLWITLIYRFDIKIICCQC